MLRKLGTLNFLNELKYGALTVTLPLYLLSRGINVGDIGLILSLLPLTVILVRVFSSVIADVVGVKLFFIASSAFNALTAAVYAFAANPIQFAIGKMGEGTTDALFWAVDRTAIMARGHDRKYLALMSVVREFGGSLGLVGAGLVIAYFSFAHVFMVLAVLGIAGVAISSGLVNRGATVKQPQWKSILKVTGREDGFWKVSAGAVLLYISFTLVFTFLLPVMMDVELEMEYLTIAVMLAVFYVSMGMGSLLSAHFNMNENKLFVFQAVAVPFMLALPYSGGYLPLTLMAAGFGFGVCFGVMEAMIGYVSGKGRGLASKLAVLFVPLNLATFVVFSLTGFALEALGSESLFAFAALLLAGFIVLAKTVMDEFDGRKMRVKVSTYHRHAGPKTERIK